MGSREEREVNGNEGNYASDTTQREGQGVRRSGVVRCGSQWVIKPREVKK